MKSPVHFILKLFEIILLPLIFVSAMSLWFYRRIGSRRLPLSTAALKKIGVFPIINHYYEPLFNDKMLNDSLAVARKLPGLDFNIPSQLKLISTINYSGEFIDFVNREKIQKQPQSFEIHNASYCSGDAEFLYGFVRHFKPKRIVEIGCGNSTKIIHEANRVNFTETASEYEHVCIEPFEQPWLNSFNDIELIRSKVEDLDLSYFDKLQAGDFLFIDSSHVIRPQGDVLHEYLTLIPNLNEGVFIHVHDIFSPHDYLQSWIKDDVKFWNEQYLLEALLSNTDSYEVIAALNLLKRNHYDELQAVCPFITEEREPGAFYFKKTKGKQ